MDAPANEGLGMAPYRSPSVEQALRELAQLAITEACLSGICDMCLYQTEACLVDQHWEDSHLSRRPQE